MPDKGELSQEIIDSPEYQKYIEIHSDLFPSGEPMRLILCGIHNPGYCDSECIGERIDLTEKLIKRKPLTSDNTTYVSYDP